MLIFKKEKAVRDLVLAHLGAAHDCVAEARGVLEDYLAGESESMTRRAADVKALERQADTLKRQIRQALHDGAFLPQVRSDVHGLVEGLDRVAGAAEHTMQFIVGQSPVVPEPFETDLMDLFGNCVNCFHELRKAMQDFFDPRGEIGALHQHAERVSQIESGIDVLQGSLTRRMFDSDAELARKIHFSQLVRHVAEISDLAKALADELESVVMRTVV